MAPLVELRSPFTLDRAELADADRGAVDLDLDAVIAAGRAAALAEDQLVFHGYPQAGVAGVIPSSPHEKVAISDDYSELPGARGQGRGRPAGGGHRRALRHRPRGEVLHGGHRDDRARRLPRPRSTSTELLGGPVVWAPAVDGAVVLSQRGGDFELTVGQDFAIGYRSSDATSVDLYLEESATFRVLTPEAAVHLAYL